MIYNSVRQDYAAFNLSDKYICIVISNDSIDKLSKIIPVNLNQLGYGSAKDVPLFSKDMKIECFLTVIMHEDYIYMLSPNDCYEFCRSKLDQALEPGDYIQEFNGIYLIEGPSAAEKVCSLINDDVRSIQYYDSVYFQINSTSESNNVCMRCSFFGEIGYLLLVNQKGEHVVEFLNQLNFSSFVDPEVAVLVGEANSRVWNKSIFRADCPIEIGLSHVLDFGDDEFEYHSELNQIRSQNQNRMVAIIFKENIPDGSNDTLDNDVIYCQADDKAVGSCIRIHHSKQLNKTIGYAKIQAKYSYLGTELYHKIYGKLEVHKAPFFITKSHFI